MRHPLAVLLVALVISGCGANGSVAAGCLNCCPDAVIVARCANADRSRCIDGHSNTCLLCMGPSVTASCIYDPAAPPDGGTAVCVAHCTD
jgi:hypothetical protein